MISNGLISMMQSGLLIFLGCSILLRTRPHYTDTTRANRVSSFFVPALIRDIKTKIFEFP